MARLRFGEPVSREDKTETKTPELPLTYAGEWQAQLSDFGRPLIVSPNGLIAQCCLDGDEFAGLLAAAPELLKACESAAEALRFYAPAEIDPEVLQDLDAALAKAREAPC